MDIRTHKEDSCWMISGFKLGAVFETSGAPAQKRCGRERYNCAPLVLVPPQSTYSPPYSSLSHISLALACDAPKRLDWARPTCRIHLLHLCLAVSRRAVPMALVLDRQAPSPQFQHSSTMLWDQPAPMLQSRTVCPVTRFTASKAPSLRPRPILNLNLPDACAAQALMGP